MQLRQLSAAILCGGRSRRMGLDKSLLLTDCFGKTLLEHQASSLAQSFGQVMLVAEAPLKFLGVSGLKGFDAFADIFPDSGPLSAIYTALVNSCHPYVFVMACDMPEMNMAFIESLACEIKENDVVLPRHDGYIEPLHAFYSVELAKKFKKFIDSGERQIRKAFEGSQVKYVETSPDDWGLGLFDNFNTLTDLAGNRQGFTIEGLTDFEVLKYKNGFLTKKMKKVIEERPVDLWINGQTAASAVVMPQQLNFWAIGLMYSEGFIKSIEEIKDLTVQKKPLRIEVVLNSETPGSGFSTFSPDAKKDADPNTSETSTESAVKSEVRLRPEEISELMKAFRNSGLFSASGAVSRVCLHQAGDFIGAGDINACNALNKVIGQMLARGFKVSETMLLMNGQPSRQFAYKAARAGIGMIVAQEEPTSQAILQARVLGQTLISTDGDGSFNLYSGFSRVAGGTGPGENGSSG